jgi:hypothetical protein
MRSASKVASLVAVLKVARQLQLVRDLGVVSIPGHPPVVIPEELLQRAICHSNESLLVDALTLACVHPKTTAMPGRRPSPEAIHPYIHHDYRQVMGTHVALQRTPYGKRRFCFFCNAGISLQAWAEPVGVWNQCLCTGALELQMVAGGLLLGMRCVSTSLRNKLTTLVGKLLRRIHTSTHALLHRWTTKSSGPGGADAADRAQDLAGGPACTFNPVEAFLHVTSLCLRVTLLLISLACSVA